MTCGWTTSVAWSVMPKSSFVKDRHGESAMKRRLQLIGLIAIVGTGLLASAERLRAYVTNGHVWGTTQVRYFVNPTNLYVSPADAIADVQNAAGDWNTQAGVNVKLSYAGTTTASVLALDYTNNIFFRNDSSGAIAETYWWWDGSGNLVDADTVLHENYKFYAGNAGCAGDGYYIENTLAHEFGHALGMGHSTVTTATMYPYSGICETIRESLDPDDIAGIQSIYPLSTGQPPAAPTQLNITTSTANPTSGLALAWVDQATNANGYRVDRSTDGVSFGTVAQLGSSAVSYADSGLSAGSTYYYRVSAYNSAGTSSYSNVATGQTQAPSSAPSAPTNPKPTNGATGVAANTTLSWASSSAQTFDVYINGSLFVSNITSPSIAVSSLAPASTYNWQVVAKNMVGSTAGPVWTFTTQVPNPKKGGPKH